MMSSPPSFSFSKPAMPGDAVSVLVLVEDSASMAAKWPDVRDSYLPNLLENIRTADPSVQMEARWLTTSSVPSALPSILIRDAAQARTVHDLAVGLGSPTKLCPAVITNAITTLSSATQRQSTTRHLILVAATGPLGQGTLNDSIPSGFDSWDEIALVLKQQYIRLHVILNIGAEMRTYHELFKRSLQLQNNSEVTAWFFVDSRRFSIRLSGRPQYVRGSAPVPVSLVPTPIPEGSYNNPSPPASSPTPVSPPSTTSTPTSPSHTTPSSSRKTTTAPTTSRNRPRGATDSPQSAPATEGGGGLVSYLQMMHGLTKKKTYGIKAPKQKYNIRLPNAGRPILPRLEVPPSASDIYTYPTFDNPPPSELQATPTDLQLPPPRRHSADQLPSASLVVRTNNGDRRTRGRGPWLPIAPLVSSTPSSPTAATSPGTLAALQSLASMTPRLPDFVTRDRPTGCAYNSTDPSSTYQVAQPTGPMTGAYYPSNVGAWAQQASVGTSPTAAPSPTYTVSSLSDASRQVQTSPPTPQLVRSGSDYSYGSSPPSSSSTTPPSITASMGGDSLEDQPFVVTPEYEALVNARFDEAVRSGAMQASMTSAIPNDLPPTSTSSSTYAAPAPAQEQMYYPTMSPTQSQQAMSHDAGYPVSQLATPGHLGNGVMFDNDMQASWSYVSYAPPDYPPPHTQWYPTA